MELDKIGGVIDLFPDAVCIKEGSGYVVYSFTDSNKKGDRLGSHSRSYQKAWDNAFDNLTKRQNGRKD
jgi:hypothetical protein